MNSTISTVLEGLPVCIFTEFHIALYSLFFVIIGKRINKWLKIQSLCPLRLNTYTHIAQSFIDYGSPEVGFHDCYFAESEELKKIICKHYKLI